MSAPESQILLCHHVGITFPLAIHVGATLPFVKGSGGVKSANTGGRRVKGLSCEQTGSGRRIDQSAAWVLRLNR